MKIRKVTINDFKKLKELKSEFYLWECKGDKRLNPEYVKRGLGARLAKNLRQKNTVFFVAEEKEKLIGYSGGEIQKNPAFAKFKKRGHLFNLYVKPEYRSKGIGKKLIRATLSWFRKKKVSDLTIMVYSHNKSAYKIYKNLGFKDYILELKN